MKRSVRRIGLGDKPCCPVNGFAGGAKPGMWDDGLCEPLRAGGRQAKMNAGPSVLLTVCRPINPEGLCRKFYGGPMNIEENQDDYDDLKRAVALLESPSITARISALIGMPVKALADALPGFATRRINGMVAAALGKSAAVALWSLENQPGKQASPRLNKVYAALSGAAAGAFGFTALALELPVTTTIMMRAVADIARAEGFDLKDFTTRQACLEVFALGGNEMTRAASDGVIDIRYYTARGFVTETMQALSKELADAAASQVGHGLHSLSGEQAGKWLAKLIEKVAGRFGVVITEKFAAQAVPVIGAATGAAINVLFTNFYQDMARGHFIVRRLEGVYGVEAVRGAYGDLLDDLSARKD